MCTRHGNVVRRLLHAWDGHLQVQSRAAMLLLVDPLGTFQQESRGGGGKGGKRFWAWPSAQQKCQPSAEVMPMPASSVQAAILVTITHHLISAVNGLRASMHQLGSRLDHRPMTGRGHKVREHPFCRNRTQQLAHAEVVPAAGLDGLIPGPRLHRKSTLQPVAGPSEILYMPSGTRSAVAATATRA